MKDHLGYIIWGVLDAEAHGLQDLRLLRVNIFQVFFILLSQLIHQGLQLMKDVLSFLYGLQYPEHSDSNHKEFLATQQQLYQGFDVNLYRKRINQWIRYIFIMILYFLRELFKSKFLAESSNRVHRLWVDYLERVWLWKTLLIESDHTYQVSETELEPIPA